jgi:hypothetical protein
MNYPLLYIVHSNRLNQMSITSPRKVINEHDNSKIAWGFLAVIVIFGLFVVGYGQGHIFSIV